MSKNRDSYTHYLVVDERILGEALLVEKVNDCISLAFVKLSGQRPSICLAFVENQALVPKVLN
jgi:hypothetical protein